MNQSHVDPDLMSAGERLDEVAAILAAGIRRLREKQSKSSTLRDVSLDFSAPRSVHGTPPSGESP